MTKQAHIFIAGDPSVGINSATMTVDFGGVDLGDPLEREGARTALKTCFSEIVGEQVNVMFDDDRQGEPEYD